MAQRLGFIRSSGSFNIADAQGLTNVTTEVFTNTRNLGELGLGDVIYSDAGGTTPFNGGGLAYGFVEISGTTSDKRGVKINPDGTINDYAYYNNTTPNSYYKDSGNCSSTGINSGIFHTNDDLSIYPGKRMFANSSGQLIATGTHIHAFTSNGTPVATFTVNGLGIITGVTSCAGNTNPLVFAGVDQAISLPTNSVTVDGSYSSTLAGKIFTNYTWSKISGPASFNIVNANAVTTVINNLVEGTYVFQLSGTDSGGLSSTDQIQIQVINPPCSPSVEITVDPRMAYDLIGGDGNAGDPLHNLFSSDPTLHSHYTTKITDFCRWRDNNNDLIYRLILINFQRPYNITKITANTANIGGGNQRLHISLGQKCMTPAMLIRGYDNAPDITLNLSAGGTDTILLDNQSIKTQYMIIRFVDNSDLRNLKFFGCPANEITTETTYNYVDIGPRTHSMAKLEDLKGFNITALLNPGSDQVNWANKGVMRTYDAGTLYLDTNGDSIPDTLTAGDKDNVNWTIGGANTNKFYLNPYNVPYSVTDFGVDMAAQGNKQLVTLRGGNGHYRMQMANAGFNKFNIRSINDINDNPRDPQSYDRFAWYAGMYAYFYGSNPTPPTDDVRYDVGCCGDSPTPGKNFVKYIAPGNELDAWFFGDANPTGSRVHSPIEVAAIHTRVYPKIKHYDPNMSVILQSVTSHQWNFQKTTILCCRIFAQSRSVPFDNHIEVHVTKPTKEFFHLPTTGEQIGNKGAVPEFSYTAGGFPGVSEYQKIRTNIEMLWDELGYEPSVHITEYAYNTNLYKLAPESDIETFTVSQIAAPTINSHTRFESQAICLMRYMIQMGQAGIQGANTYQAYDDQISASTFYDAPDQSNGLAARIGATPPSIQGNKPSYYMLLGFLDKMKDYKFDSTIAQNGTDNGDIWAYKLNHATDSTKSAYIVVYGKEADSGTPQYTIPITGSVTITKWNASFTNLTGTSGTPFVQSGNYTVDAKVVPDIYFIEGGNTPPTVDAGNDQFIVAPTSSTSLTATASDPGGSITTYLWEKLVGPSGGTIASPGSATTNITGLNVGLYKYRITVTDNGGAQASDTVKIYVFPTGSTTWDEFGHLKYDPTLSTDAPDSRIVKNAQGQLTTYVDEGRELFVTPPTVTKLFRTYKFLVFP